MINKNLDGFHRNDDSSQGPESYFKEDNDKLTNALNKLRGQMAVAGDHQTAAKLSELVEKQAASGVHVAFCGHFSAGKSTLINRLLEDPLLPASPIPTSANLVTISYGREPRAQVCFYREKQGELTIAEQDQINARSGAVDTSEFAAEARAPVGDAAVSGAGIAARSAVAAAARARASSEEASVATVDKETEHEQVKEVVYGPQDFSRMAAYFTNSEEVKEIRLFLPSPLLQSGLYVLDTPGIDSNEAAHQLATMSALHLADAVFYVMDYNHVQSEVNLHFVKMLQGQDKPVFLVVNQIDKHVAWELPFSAYRQNVEETFADWGIQPAGFFYISLKQPDHAEDQWAGLLEVLRHLPCQESALRTGSTQLAARQLVKQHIRFLEERQMPAREAAENVLKGAAAETILQHGQTLQEQLSRFWKMPEDMVAAAREELARLLENAPITSYEVREKGRLYLKAREKAAKAGRWQAKRLKQAEEIALTEFFQDVQAQVERHLLWHVRTFLAALPERFQLKNESWQAQAYQMEVTLTEALLADTVKEGAQSDAYILNYMKDVGEEIKNLVRRAALALLEEAVRSLKEEQAGEVARLEQEIFQAEERARAAMTLQQLDEELQQVQTSMLQQLEEIFPLEEVRLLQGQVLKALASQKVSTVQEAVANLSDEDDEDDVLHSFQPDMVQDKLVVLSDEVPILSVSRKTSEPQLPGFGASGDPQAPVLHGGAGERDMKMLHTQEVVDGAFAAPVKQVEQHVPHMPDRLQETVQLLKRCADRMTVVPGFQPWVQEVRKRADRLSARRFTVALFGAFSAGKSSFANALLGDRVLPVSPNPTTAAINQILPPDADHPHGTGEIQMKSPAQMAADIRASLRELKPAAEGEFGLSVQRTQASDGKRVKPGQEERFDSFSLMDDELSDERLLGEAWMEVIARALERVDRATLRPGSQPHAAFLRAVLKGYQEMWPLLGECLSVNLGQFQAYVAVEEKACFVEQVRLYNQCPLTSYGITLVDTPGADSMNARHTDVAFRYMKEADAILFVTYYNHAFSRADREMLIQMGRVKSALEMDKMFFILNAKDLAGSCEELQGVAGHLCEALTRFGISEPRIFPVSSQLALLGSRQASGCLRAEEEPLLQSLLQAARRGQMQKATRITRKMDVAPVGQADFFQSDSFLKPWEVHAQLLPAGHQEVSVQPPAIRGQVSSQFHDDTCLSAVMLSGISEFEMVFYPFMFEDLAQVAEAGAHAEIQRGLEQLDEMIRMAQTEEGTRKAALQRLERNKLEMRKVIAAFQVDAALDALAQEVEELFYYVNERLLMRYPDFYQEAFAVVGSDDQRENRTMLEEALQELLQYLAQEMEQEVRVTSLRIERFILREAGHAADILQEQTRKVDAHYPLAAPSEPKFPEAKIRPALKWLPLSQFRSCLSMFKNPRHFYEKGGSAAMREAIREVLKPPLEEYLTLHREAWGALYRHLMEETLIAYIERVGADADRYYEGLTGALTEPGQLKNWLAIRDEVQNELRNHLLD